MNSWVHCSLSGPWASLALWAVYAMVATPTPYCCSLRPFTRLATPSKEVGTIDRLPSSASGFQGGGACPAVKPPPERSGWNTIVGRVPQTRRINSANKDGGDAPRFTQIFGFACWLHRIMHYFFTIHAIIVKNPNAVNREHSLQASVCFKKTSRCKGGQQLGVLNYTAEDNGHTGRQSPRWDSFMVAVQTT